MEALGQVEYRQSWYFWLWCRPSKRTATRDRRLYAWRRSPTLPWQRGMRLGIVAADEVAHAKGVDGSIGELHTTLERRDGVAHHGRRSWQLELRMALLKEASGMEGERAAD